MSRTSAKAWRVALVAAVACAACRTPPVTPLPWEELTARLPILGIEGASRADLLLRLGPPSAAFEGERVLAWRLDLDDRELRPTALRVRSEEGAGRSWEAADYSLVVVFDEAGVVQRSAAISVR